MTQVSSLGVSNTILRPASIPNAPREATSGDRQRRGRRSAIGGLALVPGLPTLELAPAGAAFGVATRHLCVRGGDELA